MVTILLPAKNYAAPIVDNTLEYYITQEEYTNAFNYLENKFKEQNFKSDTLSFYLFKTADCLFKTRFVQSLDTLLQLIEKHKKTLTPYYLAKTNVVKLNYLREKESTSIDKSEILSEINNCQYADVKRDYTLLLALWQITNNELEDSRKNYKSIFYNKQSDTIQKAQAANGLGAYYTYQSKYDSAKIFYHISQELYSKKWNPKHSKVAMAIYNLALIENRFGNYALSEKMIKEVLAIYLDKLGNSHIRTAEAYGELGSIYLMQDNLEKALSYILKEGAILEKLYNKNNINIAYSLLNSGKVYYFLNDLENATQQLNKGIDLLTKNNQTQSNTYVQLNIERAKILHKKREFNAAIQLLEPIVKNKKNEIEDVSEAMIQLGTNYAALHKTKEALNTYQTAIKQLDEIYGVYNVYSIHRLLLLSDLYLQMNNAPMAHTVAIEATKRTIKDNFLIFPYNHWECALQEVKCKKEIYLQSATKLDATTIKLEIENIKNIYKQANKIRQTYYTAGARIYFAENIAALNELGIFYTTQLYKKRDVYAINSLLFFTEYNKANLLRDKLVNQNYNELLPLEEQLKSTVITDRLNYFYSLNENQEKTTFSINDSILYYQNLYEDFSKAIEKKYPKIYQIKYGNEPITTQIIQHKLNENTSYLSYFNDGEKYYCIAIEKDNILFKDCGKLQEIENIAEQYIASVLQKKANDSLSIKLYQKIIPKYLRNNVVISTDKVLQTIPFDALKENSSTYLLQKNAVEYAFSAHSYFNYQKGKPNKKVLTFFPDFANTQFAPLNNKQEHESLKAYKEYNVYHNKAATKNTFVKACNNTGIIHIASHLLTDTLQPLRSALVFQPTKDYLLTIQDIWKLKSNCQLVTLAACESNFGKKQIGEGVQNFAWAFYYAGAQHILSTNWNAADKSTDKITAQFYNNLHTGKTASVALQEAKINYLKNTDAIGAQPYYWAQLSLIGNANAIKMSPVFFSNYWWILAIVSLLVFYLLISYRKYIKI